jgi:hypothetical protein
MFQGFFLNKRILICKIEKIMKVLYFINLLNLYPTNSIREFLASFYQTNSKKQSEIFKKSLFCTQITTNEKRTLHYR